jgi:hypothetical protein
MKKTFCDRCDAQCVNTTIMVQVTTVHHTKDNTYVGDDVHAPAEICLNCASEVEAVIPQAFRIRQKEPEEAMIAESPVREDFRHMRVSQDAEERFQVR